MNKQREYSKISDMIRDGLQYGAKLESVILFVSYLGIWWRHTFKFHEIRHFEICSDIERVSRQIYRKLR